MMTIMTSQNFCRLAAAGGVIFLVLFQELTVVSGGDAVVCENWCAKNPNPWTNSVNNPGAKQKCNWKKCGGCPQCPMNFLFKCPELSSDDPLIVPSGKLVKLYNSDRGRLCTLTRKSIHNGSAVESISPVARSYDANPWENTAGDYTNLPISCNSVYCMIEIPSIINDDNPTTTDVVFQLTSFDASSDREMDERIMIARFLEQATFGPTRDEIKSWNNDYKNMPFESSFPRWISDQINEKTPTFHRDYFRRRANTRIRRTVDLGRPSHPCETLSRWSSYALTRKDVGDFLRISGQQQRRRRTTTTTTADDGRSSSSYLFSIRSVPRTVVTNIATIDGATLSLPGNYKICTVNERTGGKVTIKVGSSCVELVIGNPPIDFPSNVVDDDFTKTIPNVFVFDSRDDFAVLDPNKQDDEFIHTTAIINDPQCDFLHVNDAFPAFARFPKNDDDDADEWLLYDPRLVLRDNTLTNPLLDGGGSATLDGSTCANAPKTFLNIDSCRLSDESSTCRGAEEFDDVPLTLNDETIKKLSTLTRLYVYAVERLRPDASPCVPSYTSRWVKIDAVDCPVEMSYDGDTIETISDLLKKSDHPRLRDVEMTENAICDIGSTRPVNGRGMKIAIDDDGDDCWENVHPHHHNVYDMTYWTKDNAHPGNQLAAADGRPNPIKAFAENGEAVLYFPEWHSMDQWNNNEKKFDLIGTYDEDVSFLDLPQKFRLPSVANEFGAGGASDADDRKGIVVCGSPGEVANDLTLGDRYDMPLDDDNDEFPFVLEHQNEFVWTNVVALHAADQLRQRVAWALSQILAISPKAINAPLGVECYLNYYDIFVRHAFGNYRDVLKEVSYSPMMAEMLSYLNSQSTSHAFHTSGKVYYPDENYAREIMQLFTIGTIQLAMDGTPILDGDGTTIPTYDNDDIMTYARAWTGFSRQRRRGNIEDINNVNRIDPMTIVPYWRDLFPKANLYGGYVGDGYSLCADLPRQSFLKRGAIYRLLGSRTSPELSHENWSHFGRIVPVVLVRGRSELYDALCHPDTDGNSDSKGDDDDCRFLNQVVLERDLSCNAHDDVECTIDAPRVVRVDDHTFYEYVQPPCVQLSFYNDGKKISGWWQNIAMCGNPQLVEASEACCDSGKKWGYRNCAFVGERMTYGTASSRCEDMGKETCHFNSINRNVPHECNDYSRYHWNDAPCEISVKIDPHGKIAIVHEPERVHPDHPAYELPNVILKRVSRDSPSYFRVRWHDGKFPKSSNGCAVNDGVSCDVIEDGGCFCRTHVIEDVVFASFGDLPSTARDLLSLVSIGSRPPDSFFDDGSLFDSPKSTTPGDEIKVYYRVGETMNRHTIFEVTVHGRKKYYRNIKSTVFIRTVDDVYDTTASSSFAFRNPPHFMSFATRVERDGHYETDAVLDDYFHHDNTAPFLAMRFIQRFGISNPSPRFVKVVATAFVEGSYDWNDTQQQQFRFGSGDYGDLAAMVAAILLDRESRSAILDKDPTHGSLKEPLLKLIGLMRSMEFRPKPYMPEVRLRDVVSSIGQMAHEIPSVFSFFLPEYAPPGPISSASLLAPEAQLLLMPKVVGLLNGMFSLIKYGLTQCYGGLGYWANECTRREEGNYGRALGSLTFYPESNTPYEVINELSMLLTAGRLNDESRRIIENIYRTASNTRAGLRLAQQLILTTAEFHSTNLVEINGDKARGNRNDDTLSGATPPTTPTDSSYKAIVFLLLKGGCDSYNMIIPHSSCQQQKDMYQEYLDVRGDLALSNTTKLRINASGSAQICDNFFLHPKLPYLKTLYDRKDALFLANTGVLTEPVTKDDWDYKTKTTLFAHNVQQKVTQQIVVDPSEEDRGTGVLGRMTDILTKKGYKTGSVSISDDSYVLVGSDSSISPPINVLSEEGISEFNEKPSMEHMSSTIKALNNATMSTSGLFADTWSDVLYTSIDQNEALSQTLDSTKSYVNFPDSYLGKQLDLVSRMIKAHRKRGTQRDVFYVTLDGFDTHSDMQNILTNKFVEINAAIKSFSEEMERQNKWYDVVILETSDFGRTLTPNNGDGTDHGWGGNHFMIGGGVNGGRILGDYPNDLTDAGPQSIERGRFIPTTSWDEVWNGIGEWFGVTEEDDLDKLLPNRRKFNNLLRRDDLFTQGPVDDHQRRKHLRNWS